MITHTCPLIIKLKTYSYDLNVITISFLFLPSMTNQQESYSPNKKAFKRFLKNKPAVFGAIVILLASMIALLGYLITPDSTPDTNDQIPEAALQSPGFAVKMLKVKKNKPIEKRNIFHQMLFGVPNSNRLIPINNYEFKSDSIFFEKFSGYDSKGELVQGTKEGLNIADVFNALSSEKNEVVRIGDQLSYYDVSNQLKSDNIQFLQKEIESKSITKKSFLLGTDRFGRSLLSRLILGVRISLIVGLIAVFISLTLGIFIGAIAGYFGGRIDDVIMLLINTVWSIPTLLLVFAIVLALGRGIGIIFLAVGLTMWVDVARIVRGQIMSFRKVQFVEAAQSMGFANRRIILKHILPNIIGPVMVIAAANFATAILIEAGLSYLGFGIQPPTPSWGTMLNENYGYAISGKPFLALIPAFAIMTLVLAFNLVGNGFRDALDVKSK